jgi:hypothetical protein
MWRYFAGFTDCQCVDRRLGHRRALPRCQTCHAITYIARGALDRAREICQVEGGNRAPPPARPLPPGSRLCPKTFQSARPRGCDGGWAIPMIESTVRYLGIEVDLTSDLPARSGCVPSERPYPAQREPCCLSGETQLPNILQNPPKRGFWCEAHSSIRIQEGEPNKIKQLMGF